MRLAIFFASLLVFQAGSARADWWTDGGPISDALQQAIEEKDKKALRKIWSGEILLVNQATKSVEPVAASTLFKFVDGCDMRTKFDNSPHMNEQENSDFKGAVSWTCPNKRVAGKKCAYEEYVVEIGPIRYFSKKTAFYVLPDEGYDAEKCGKPRPAASPTEAN